jgi:hypothetical protein
VKYASSAGISKLDFSTGNVIYLSEMNSTESAPPATSIVGEPVWRIVKDTWPDNVPFKLRDTTFTRGLALPPEFSLTFKLNADFRELKTTVGVDDRYRELDWGARLIIEADGKAVFNDLIKRTDKSRELTLDVKNVKSLTIRVEPESTSARTFILLADARLQK